MPDWHRGSDAHAHAEIAVENRKAAALEALAGSIAMLAEALLALAALDKEQR